MSRGDLKHRKFLSDVSKISNHYESGFGSRSSSMSDCDNEYLCETKRIVALGDEIRREIERRFRRSRINATYIFPRITKAKAAPTPPSHVVSPSVPISMVASRPKMVRVKTAKSISHSRNSSFSRLNDSQTKSNASLNVSYQKPPPTYSQKPTPTHSRAPSLTKQLSRSQKPGLKPQLSASKSKLLTLIQSPYLGRPAESRLAARTTKGKKLTPASLDTSLMLKPPISKSFLKQERLC